jgi:hypothetical protein
MSGIYEKVIKNTKKIESLIFDAESSCKEIDLHLIKQRYKIRVDNDWIDPHFDYY